MIFLLHGEPGVGKTLTAESVADFCGRPLLRLDAACLGTTAADVEASLSSILRFATKWSAVALLDEADVFLEQRHTNNIKHNALVSGEYEHESNLRDTKLTFPCQCFCGC